MDDNQREIDIDLEKNTVLGWESGQIHTFFNSIVAGILVGDEFPRVGVLQVEDNVYELTKGFYNLGLIDGGHHRTIAHYALGRPLPALILPYESNPEETMWKMDMRDSSIVKDFRHTPDYSVYRIPAKELTDAVNGLFRGKSWVPLFALKNYFAEHPIYPKADYVPSL